MFSSNPYPFPYQKLDAYVVALDLAAASKRLADKVPHGYRTFADQLLRSGGRVPLLVAEGCCRRTPAQKRQRFGEARGECGEAGAAAEVLAVLGLVPVEDARKVHDLASRESAILFGMVRRFTRKGATALFSHQSSPSGRGS